MYRYKKRILYGILVFIVIIILGGLFLYLQPRKYEAGENYEIYGNKIPTLSSIIGEGRIVSRSMNKNGGMLYLKNSYSDIKVTAEAVSEYASYLSEEAGFQFVQGEGDITESNTTVILNKEAAEDGYELTIEISRNLWNVMLVIRYGPLL